MKTYILTITFNAENDEIALRVEKGASSIELEEGVNVIDVQLEEQPQE